MAPAESPPSTFRQLIPEPSIHESHQRHQAAVPWEVAMATCEHDPTDANASWSHPHSQPKGSTQDPAARV